MSEDAREIAVQGLARVTALLKNPDVAWFLEETVAKPLQQADDDCKDLRKTPEERTGAAHVYNALKPIADFLQDRKTTFEGVLKGE